MNFTQALQIASIVFGVGGIGSFLLSIKRFKSQNTLDLSTAWEKFAAPLMQRVTYLENRTHEQDKEIAELNERVMDQEIEIEDLRGWAERLVQQVIKYAPSDIEPSKFVRRKKKDGIE
jgi:uncharacterized coiled-coil protein SlyX